MDRKKVKKKWNPERNLCSGQRAGGGKKGGGGGN